MLQKIVKITYFSTLVSAGINRRCSPERSDSNNNCLLPYQQEDCLCNHGQAVENCDLSLGKYQCEICDDWYHLELADNGRPYCVVNTCICDHGRPAQEGACPTHNLNYCECCEDGYIWKDWSCQPENTSFEEDEAGDGYGEDYYLNQITDGQPGFRPDVEEIMIDFGTDAPIADNNCTCKNGTPSATEKCPEPNTNHCASCESDDYILCNHQCIYIGQNASQQRDYDDECNGCNGCYFPHAEENKYVQCRFDRPVIRNCPEHTVWRQDLLVCSWPAEY